MLGLVIYTIGIVIYSLFHKECTSHSGPECFYYKKGCYRKENTLS